MNDSAVLLAGDLAWPIVVLIISIMVLASQRKALAQLIGRIKTFKGPGGVEAELNVPETGADALQTLVTTLSKNVIEATEREETAGPGTDADETVQNREPLASAGTVVIDKVTDNVVTLATEVAHQLAELAYPPPPDAVESLSGLIDTLHGRGVLDRPTADSLRRVADIANQAARGAMVPARVATAVENSGPAILNQLATLQTVAAAQFEDHVLDELQERAPREWSIDIDRAMPSDNQPDEETSGASAATKARHARVDALVSDDHQEAVVEVRARLQPTKPGQIEAVRQWMKALPSDVPVLLIMLGKGLSARQLREISEGHQGQVELLEWDRDSDELIRVLRGLLRAPAPERPEVLV